MATQAHRIERSDLKFVKKIGEGGYSEVFEMLWQSQGDRQVAVKKLNKLDTREVDILLSLEHTNIVQLLGVVDEETDYMLVLEYCEGGSLRSYLDKHSDQPLTPQLFYDWAEQAAKPVKYLQQMRIIHKDIKSANYLITEDNFLKLADFGLSKKIGITMSNASGSATCAYMAPELATDNKLSPSYDIFALAVVLWELWTRKVPFKGKESMNIMWRVCSNNERLHIPPDVPEILANLLKQCWVKDRQRRPSIDEVLSTIQEARMLALGVHEQNKQCLPTPIYSNLSEPTKVSSSSELEPNAATTCPAEIKASTREELPKIRYESHDPNRSLQLQQSTSSMDSVHIYDNVTTYNVSIHVLVLHGKYILCTDPLKFILVHPETGNVLYEWPYKYIKKYGRDLASFTIEVGRKCNSGPGRMVFQTAESNSIFHEVQTYVNNLLKEKQDHHNKSSHNIVTRPLLGATAAPPLQQADDAVYVIDHLHQAGDELYVIDHLKQKNKSAKPPAVSPKPSRRLYTTRTTPSPSELVPRSPVRHVEATVYDKLDHQEPKSPKVKPKSGVRRPPPNMD